MNLQGPGRRIEAGGQRSGLASTACRIFPCQGDTCCLVQNRTSAQPRCGAERSYRRAALTIRGGNETCVTAPDDAHVPQTRLTSRWLSSELGPIDGACAHHNPNTCGRVVFEQHGPNSALCSAASSSVSRYLIESVPVPAKQLPASSQTSPDLSGEQCNSTTGSEAAAAASTPLPRPAHAAPPGPSRGTLL